MGPGANGVAGTASPKRRNGRARQQVLDALRAQAGPISAERLAELVPDVHVSSVYRALAVLEEEGIAVHVHLGHGPAVYQLATHAAAVRHLVCERCGHHELVPVSLFDPLSEALARDYGFVLDVDHFAVVGRCATCRL